MPFLMRDDRFTALWDDGGSWVIADKRHENKPYVTTTSTRTEIEIGVELRRNNDGSLVTYATRYQKTDWREDEILNIYEKVRAQTERTVERARMELGISG